MTKKKFAMEILSDMAEVSAMIYDTEAARARGWANNMPYVNNMAYQNAQAVSEGYLGMAKPTPYWVNKAKKLILAYMK